MEIENPPGWKASWLFKQEIALWEIAQEERGDSLLYEMARELEGEHCPLLTDGGDSPPWLALDLTEKARARDCLLALAFHQPQRVIPPLELGSGSDVAEILCSLPPEAMRAFARWLSRAADAKADGEKPVPENCPLRWHPLALPEAREDGVPLLLHVNAALATATEIKAAFSSLLERLPVAKPARGKKDSDDLSNLQALAILRLRHWLPGDVFWQPLKNTVFQFWGDAKKPETIREKADKYRERILLKLRTLCPKVEPRHAQTHSQTPS